MAGRPAGEQATGGDRPRVTGVRPWAAGDRGSGRGPRVAAGDVPAGAAPAIHVARAHATCPRAPRRQFTWHVHMRRGRHVIARFSLEILVGRAGSPDLARSRVTWPSNPSD